MWRLFCRRPASECPPRSVSHLGHRRARFIEAGTVEGLDHSCLAERPPTEFVLPEEEEAGNRG